MQEHEISKLVDQIASKFAEVMVGDADEQDQHRRDHDFIRERRINAADRRLRTNRIVDQVWGAGLIGLVGALLAWLGWGFLHWLGLR